jgi:Rad3-related DNA helicase
MPYNYLMEDFSHEQSSLSLENAILIIDEAHNI